MNASRTYYDILGVAPDASQDAVRTAFRSAAKRYHPDLFPSYIQKLPATAKMQELNTAYAVLRDPDNRRAYDATLPNSGMGVIYPIPHRGSKAQQPTSEGGAGATVMPRAPRSFRIDPTTAWIIFVWLIASFAFGYLQWSGIKSKTLGAFLGIAAYSLVVPPFLLMWIFCILWLPAAYIMRAFGKRSEFHQRAVPPRKGKIVLDMLLRLVGLAAVVGVGVTAWHFNFTPDLLSFGLIAAGCSLIGEIAAMIVYLSRRSIVNSTEMLLRMNPEP